MKLMVPQAGLEPALLSEQDFESGRYMPIYM
jgi:hypothetical protein